MSVLSDIAKSILFLKNDRLSKKEGGIVKGNVDFEGQLKKDGEVAQIPEFPTNDNWVIKKYPNGFCELFIRYEEKNIPSYGNTNNLYRYQTSYIDLPIKFLSQPNGTFIPELGSGVCWPGYFSLDTEKCRFFAVSQSNSTFTFVAKAHIWGYI